MAKRLISHTVFEDDLTGQEVEEGALNTLRFTIEGVQYEIDLIDANADKMRAAFGPYISAAKRIGGRKTPAIKATPASSNGTGSKSESKQIREWARTNDIEVPERGRIPDAVREQFELAHAS